MKVLLLQPPVEDFYDTDVRLQPIGLAYLQAAVKKFLDPSRVDIRIIDLHHGYGKQTIPLPPELQYLRKFYAYNDESPFSSFHHYFHFGAQDSTIRNILRDEKPDVVGISSLFTPYYREALNVARLVKEETQAKVVVGGSHVSADPLSILQDANVDYVITGEGEKAFAELLQYLLESPEDYLALQKISGLGFKRDGIPVLNASGTNFAYEELPFPDLSDFEPSTYLFQKKPMTFMLTSRSCPHRCSFCSVHTTFGKSYRRRPSEDVFREIELRYEQGYRVIDFEDDNLTVYKRPMKDLLKKIIARFPNQQMQFVAMNGISYLSLDEEMLVLMREAGFTHLNLSLVSSDSTVLETTKRPHTVEKYLEIVQGASALDFKTTSYQILGLPFETLSSMEQTLAFAAGLPVLLGASMFYLTPASPIAKTLGLPLTTKDYFKARLTAMAIETEHCNRNDVFTLFVTTRIINFVKTLPQWADEDFAALPKRTRLGIILLQKLLREKKLYAFEKGEFKPVENFSVSGFFRVWNRIEEFCGQDGRRITNLTFLEKFTYLSPLQNFSDRSLCL